MFEIVSVVINALNAIQIDWESTPQFWEQERGLHMLCPTQKVACRNLKISIQLNSSGSKHQLSLQRRLLKRAYGTSFSSAQKKYQGISVKTIGFQQVCIPNFHGLNPAVATGPKLVRDTSPELQKPPRFQISQKIYQFRKNLPISQKSTP